MRAVRAYGPALLAFALSLVVNHAAARVAAVAGARSPTLPDDLLLGWLPYVDVSGLFVWGFLAFAILAVAGGLRDRARIPYVLWMYALLISLRAFFIVLTPMGAPPGWAPPEGWLYETIGRHLTRGHDLFFSSHTALPFLGFLVFREMRIRVGMLALSLVLAACVLVGRYHYSIDVFAAFLITYALVKVNERIARFLAERRAAADSQA